MSTEQNLNQAQDGLSALNVQFNAEGIALAGQTELCVIGWQSIDTAPMDGTEIDVWHVPYIGISRRICDVWWANGWWRNDKAHLGADMKFTHWMKKPNPPYNA